MSENTPIEDEKLISIIVPTFNRANSIIKTLKSISLQSYNYFECLVVDDYSTDNTKEIILNYSKKDERIKYLTNERRKGAQGARNTGLLNAKGDWIVFFDSDDYMQHNFLEFMIKKVIENNVDVCTCYTRIINKDSNISYSKFVCDCFTHEKLFSGECYINFDASIIKKEKLLEIGLLDEKCPSHQEKDTHFRLSKISTYTTVEEFLVDYYCGSEDSISYNKKKEIEGHIYLLKKYEWYWRYNFYRGFLKSAKYVLKLIKETTVPLPKSLKWKLFIIVPELPIISIKNKFKQKYG
ncbi:MAG TPA: glycosyltransferase [Caldisericia bacterium]|nr:glycosyltransferase [Caldisericia bacterium]